MRQEALSNLFPENEKISILFSICLCKVIDMLFIPSMSDLNTLPLAVPGD